MKTYNELTNAEKDKALAAATVSLLEAILEGSLRFNDALNHDDLQARIDAACIKAETMRTPWFAHEYILETCREDIEAMARCDAEDSLYPVRGQNVVHNIAA